MMFKLFESSSSNTFTLINIFGDPRRVLSFSIHSKLADNILSPKLVLFFVFVFPVNWLF